MSFNTYMKKGYVRNLREMMTEHLYSSTVRAIKHRKAAQAFGALMAIVIAIGLFEKGRNARQISELAKERGITEDERLEDAIDLLEEERSLWPRLWYPTQSIATLVAISLVIMMFIGSSLVWNNYAKTVFFVFLVLFAIYTLQTLIHELFKTFSGEKINTASK